MDTAYKIYASILNEKLVEAVDRKLKETRLDLEQQEKL